ncbi:MAG: AAA family ATPase [Gammaproteobacteria bacterium]|nr:AAA family ATPase [Gammaproteobacteria bacterium]
MTDQRHALSKFARLGARAQPPVFVGRKAVIEDIKDTAGLAYEMWLSGAVDAEDPGLTRLVQGAPGVGKTALLRRLREMWGPNEPSADNPICLSLTIDALSDPNKLLQAVTESLPTPVLKKWGDIVARAVAKHLVAGDEAANALVDAATAETRRLLRRDRADDFPAPVVLMVDEAQMVAPNTPQASALRSLHLGQVGDIPVLPVFAGLGYLHRHLQQEGINLSRFSDEAKCIHMLESLSDAESLELFAGWLDHFGVAAQRGDADRWGEALLRDAQGWPMHVNGFLRALAEVLATSPDPASLASADLDAVRRMAAENRAIYYNGRYAGAVEANRKWTGLAMAALRSAQPVQQDVATDLIAEVAPDNRTGAAALFDALVERGFLQQVHPGLAYACPIPSLAAHAAITAMNRPELHAAATIGDVDALRRLLADGADIEARDALGRTVLAVAAECHWDDVAETLIEAGANPKARMLTN